MYFLGFLLTVFFSYRLISKILYLLPNDKTRRGAVEIFVMIAMAGQLPSVARFEI